MLSQYQAFSAIKAPISSVMNARAAWMPGSKRFMWPTWKTLPLSATASRSASASSTVTATGFSHSTCLPAVSARREAGTWKASAVAMMTASISGSASIRS